MRRICLHLIGVWSGGSNVEDLVAKIALIATIPKLHWLHLVDFSMWQIIHPSEMKQFSLSLQSHTNICKLESIHFASIQAVIIAEG